MVYFVPYPRLTRKQLEQYEAILRATPAETRRALGLHTKKAKARITKLKKAYPGVPRSEIEGWDIWSFDKRADAPKRRKRRTKRRRKQPARSKSTGRFVKKKRRKKRR